MNNEVVHWPMFIGHLGSLFYEANELFSHFPMALSIFFFMYSGHESFDRYTYYEYFLLSFMVSFDKHKFLTLTLSNLSIFSL